MGFDNLLKNAEDAFWNKSNDETANSLYGIYRGAAKTWLGYANSATGGKYNNSIQPVLQKLEKITEERKSKGRSEERITEVEKLKEESRKPGYINGLVSGSKQIVDTLSHPGEWQALEFIGENATDPLSFVPVGKGIKAAIAIGAGTNAAQSLVFDAPRTDKTLEDKLVGATLGGIGGGVVGGVVGAATKGKTKNTETSSPDKLAKLDDDGFEKITLTKDDLVKSENQKSSPPPPEPQKIIDELQTQRAKALDKTQDELQASHPLELRDAREKAVDIDGAIAHKKAAEIEDDKPQVLSETEAINKRVDEKIATLSEDEKIALEAEGGTMFSTHRVDEIMQRLKDEVDREKLSNEESGVLDVYLGDRGSVDIKSHDLDDLVELASGSRKSGAKKIIVKHGGEDVTGGLTPLEMVKIGDTIRNGKINNSSFSETADSIRYRYDLDKHGVKLGVVVEEFNDGRKIIDYYSDRNFVGSGAEEPKAHPRRSTTLTETLSQDGKDVNTQKVGVVVKGMFEAKGDGGVITLFKGSDVGTIFHESAHYFERTFTPDERVAFDSVFGKFEDGVQRSEAFAEGFVKWVADNKYGTPELQNIFQKFANFIKEVFAQLPDSAEAKFKLEPQMQFFYKAMLGDEKAKASLQKAIEKRDAAKNSAPDGVLFQTAEAMKPLVKKEQSYHDALIEKLNKAVDKSGNFLRGVGDDGELKAYLKTPEAIRWVQRNFIHLGGRDDVSIDTLSRYKINIAADKEVAMKIYKTVETLSKDDRSALHFVLSGDVPSEKLPTHLSPLYEQIRKTVDDNADKLIKLGEILPGEKIEHYLTRLYKKDLEEAASVWSAIKSGGSGADLKIRRGKSATMHLEADDIDFAVGQKYLVKKDGKEWSVESITPLKSRPDKFEVVLHRDFDFAERQQMGEITDAAFSVYYTLQKQSEQIRRAEMLKDIPTKVFDDEEAAAKAGYVLVPEEKNKSPRFQTYGALAGQYLPKAVLDDLDFYLNISKSMGVATNAVLAFKAAKWGATQMKLNDTVKNPSTHVYNVLSNVVMTALNDPKALRYLVDSDARAAARRLGIVEGETIDLDGLRSLAGMSEADTAKTIFGHITTVAKNLYGSKDSKVGDALRTVYALEDSVFKAAVLKQKMKEGMSEAQAMAYIAHRYVDYTKPLPTFVRNLDAHGMIPFLGFAYRSTPVLLRTMANNPVKVALLGVVAASQGMSDADEMLAPAYTRGSHNLFFLPDFFKVADDGEKMKLFNFGRALPGFRINPINSITNMIEGETEIDTKLGYVGALMQIANGMGYKSNSPFAKNDSSSGSAKALALAQEFLPNYAVKLPRDLSKAASGQVDKYSGEVVTISDVAINYLGGKITTIDKAKALDILKDSAKSRIKGDIKKVAYGEIDMDELRDSVTYINKKIEPLGLGYKFSDASLKQLVNAEIHRQASLTLQNEKKSKEEKEILLKNLKDSLQKIGR